MYIYIYIYVHIYMYTYIYTDIYIEYCSLSGTIPLRPLRVPKIKAPSSDKWPVVYVCVRARVRVFVSGVQVYSLTYTYKLFYVYT